MSAEFRNLSPMPENQFPLHLDAHAAQTPSARPAPRSNIELTDHTTDDPTDPFREGREAVAAFRQALTAAPDQAGGRRRVSVQIPKEILAQADHLFRGQNEIRRGVTLGLIRRAKCRKPSARPPTRQSAICCACHCAMAARCITMSRAVMARARCTCARRLPALASSLAARCAPCSRRWACRTWSPRSSANPRWSRRAG